ncbi:MAG: RagB/SusD family nutrient uptake outer membrane protein, partial [Bacteroidales bacterium]|nr:RagB/SusD family nutrient uptake outer membrane protein [Bacteroidales bacterium]
NYFDCWTTCYGWIRRINEFLQALDNDSPLPAEQKTRYRAEALFFRGYCYHLIMRSHASVKDDLGVLIYTDISEMTAKGKNHARATVAQSWDQVWADLSFACANLPDRPAAKGRIDKYGAEAIAARAMLYAGRYAKADSLCTDIIENGGYDLEDNEAILRYDFKKVDLVHYYDQRYSSPGDVNLSGNYGGGWAGPTQEFVDMFDNADGSAFDITDASRRFITNENVGSRDPRLAAAVLWNGAEWKGRTMELFENGVDMKYMPYGSKNSPGNSVTGYYIRKNLDPDNFDYVLDGSWTPWIECRLAEVLLIRAECRAASDDFTGALNDVQTLRKTRFGRDDVITPAITSWDTALDVILHERAVELCFEGHRFWDLRRTGRAIAVLDGKKYNGVLWKKSGSGFTPQLISADMGARHYPERFDRFPIPQNEISNNTLARQNSDW